MGLNLSNLFHVSIPCRIDTNSMIMISSMKSVTLQPLIHSDKIRFKTFYKSLMVFYIVWFIIWVPRKITTPHFWFPSSFPILFFTVVSFSSQTVLSFSVRRNLPNIFSWSFLSWACCFIRCKVSARTFANVVRVLPKVVRFSLGRSSYQIRVVPLTCSVILILLKRVVYPFLYCQQPQNPALRFCRLLCPWWEMGYTQLQNSAHTCRWSGQSCWAEQNASAQSASCRSPQVGLIRWGNLSLTKTFSRPCPRGRAGKYSRIGQKKGTGHGFICSPSQETVSLITIKFVTNENSLCCVREVSVVSVKYWQ